MTAAATDIASQSTLAALLAEAGRRHGPALRFKRDGRWVRMRYADLYARVTDIGRGLIALGIRPGERVAILGATAPDWMLSDLGALSAGAVVVPIYHTNSPRECAYVLEHSGARAVIVDDEAQLAKVLEVRDECPDLEHVIVIHPGKPVPGILTMEELRARRIEVAPDRLAAASDGVDPSHPATIVYTSGTTGPPKGCIITHANLLATVTMYADELRLAEDDEMVVFMFLPLAHVLARVVQFAALKAGGEVAFWSGDAAHLLDDLKEVRPTYFPSVPRLFEKIRTAALAGLEDADPLRRALFGRAMEVGGRVRAAEREGRSPSLLDRAQYELAKVLVFSKVHALFGGRLRRALTGAAPVGRDVLDFFDACGITLLEGYGMTETCAAATLNTPWAHRIGTVGRPLYGVEVRIADDGEILMRGPNVSPGYFHDEHATADAFEPDGWLKSGDLGELDDDGYLRITGRKKDLIITSSGKNIAPSNIETMLQETRWISHAVVYGDDKPYLVALVSIDPDEAPALARLAGVPGADPQALRESAEVRALLRESIDEINARFARIEQIKRFDVLERDLTQPDGELTPTLKIRRQVVNDRYRDRFEALYRDGS